MIIKSELVLTSVEFPYEPVYVNDKHENIMNNYINLRLASINSIYNKIDLNIDMVARPLGLDLNKPIKVKIELHND